MWNNKEHDDIEVPFTFSPNVLPFRLAFQRIRFHRTVRRISNLRRYSWMVFRCYDNNKTGTKDMIVSVLFPTGNQNVLLRESKEITLKFYIYAMHAVTQPTKLFSIQKVETDGRTPFIQPYVLSADSWSCFYQQRQLRKLSSPSPWQTKLQMYACVSHDIAAHCS